MEGERKKKKELCRLNKYNSVFIWNSFKNIFNKIVFNVWIRTYNLLILYKNNIYLNINNV